MHVCHDGYTYHLNKVKGDVRYLVCTFSKTLDCKATGKIEGQFTTIKGVHNHPVPTGKNDTIIIEKALMEASIKERGNLKNIYERVAVRYPGAAVHEPYNSIRSAMLRWRRSNTPNIPQNLETLAEICLS